MSEPDVSSPRHPKRGTHRTGSGHEPTRLALESFPRIPPGHFLLFAQKKTAAGARAQQQRQGKPWQLDRARLHSGLNRDLGILYDCQLALLPLEKPPGPRSRFAAIVLIGVV